MLLHNSTTQLHAIPLCAEGLRECQDDCSFKRHQHPCLDHAAPVGDPQQVQERDKAKSAAEEAAKQLQDAQAERDR
jgi:hypothetical protein